MIVIFGARDFQTGLTIIFQVYNVETGNKDFEYTGVEVGSTGVYYADLYSLNKKNDYICIAIQSDTWKAFQYIPRK